MALAQIGGRRQTGADLHAYQTANRQHAVIERAFKRSALLGQPRAGAGLGGDNRRVGVTGGVGVNSEAGEQSESEQAL